MKNVKSTYKYSYIKYFVHKMMKLIVYYVIRGIQALKLIINL
jgi:hypothetical protein